ncbi:MAG: DNA primase [Bacilli bacterium]
MAYEKDGNNIFTEIAKKASIVTVMSYYLGSKALIKKGNNYICLCPFHADHSPSMRVDVSRNTFHCFVDNHMGDPISFVEQYAKLSPMESLKKVCEICSIPVPASVKQFKEFVPTVKQKYPEELKALDNICQFYQLSLLTNEGKKGMDYLEKRKLPKEIIEHFRLGYAPKDETQAISALRKQGFSVSVLENSGILANSTSLRDRYSEKIMFPIEDNYGNIVAFSGRQLSKDQPGGKYINYPETSLFLKRNVLYHYFQASQTARKDGFVYVVEGFMDVIAFSRAGINSVVGTMGTALTEEHIKALLALKCEVRMALDSDDRGREAIDRSLELLLKNKVPVRVQWAFHGGKDADEILTNLGKEELIKQANVLFDPFMYLFGRALKGRSHIDDTRELLEFLNLARPYYEALDPLTKEKDVKVISERSGFEKATIIPILEDKKSEKKTNISEKTPTFSQGKSNKYSRNDKKIQIDLSRFHLGNDYDEETAIQKIQSECRDYCINRKIILPLSKIDPNYGSPSFVDHMEQMLMLEANIAVVLPQSRKAFEVFQESKNCLVLSPLYNFSSLVGSIYLANPNINCFSEKEFTFLKDSLLKKKEPETSTGSDDEFYPSQEEMEQVPVDSDANDLCYPFDMDDIEKEIGPIKTDESIFDIDDLEPDETESENDISSAVVPDDECEMIYLLITIIERIKNSRYDRDKYYNCLVHVNKLYSLYNFYKSIQDDKAGVLSNSDYLKLFEILAKLN